DGRADARRPPAEVFVLRVRGDGADARGEAVGAQRGVGSRGVRRRVRRGGLGGGDDGRVEPQQLRVRADPQQRAGPGGRRPLRHEAGRRLGCATDEQQLVPARAEPGLHRRAPGAQTECPSESRMVDCGEVSASPMKTILAFGETLWDLLPTGPVLGGAPCNFAYRVNSLGDRAILVTRLGRDELGRKAFERLRQLGLDTSFVQWDDARPTGTVPVTIDGKGVPDFTITPDVAYDYIEATDELRRVIPSVDCIYCGTLVQRSEPSRRALNDLLDAKRAPVLLDLNLRKKCYTTTTIDESLKRATLVKLNETEAAEISSART